MKLLRKYNYLIIVIVFLVILYISYLDYNNTNEIIKSKYDTQNRLVENSVINALISANGAYSITEQILSKEMKANSDILVRKYKQNPEIDSWDLDKLKSKMKDYDIYIINRNFKIVRTTFKPDQGLDFSKYPSFSKLLKSRLEGDSFISDKMDISTTTGKIKKYSYIPTPDHKYLIELSINVIERYLVLEDLNIFALARQLEEKYSAVEDISFYKFNKEASTVGKIIDKKNPIYTNIPDFNKNLVRKAILTNTTISDEFKTNGYKITYKYIPFLSNDQADNYDWWNSFVVGIAYNNKEIIAEIRNETTGFYINIAIIAIVFVVFMAMMVYLLKKTEYMAYHDHLTGLTNRKAFEKYFTTITNKNKDSHKLAILYLDLDKFKSINDTHGHEVGDKLLTAVARRIKNILRKKDSVSRIGGDEFTILLTDIDSDREANIFLKKVEDHINEPYNIDGNQINIECSIGKSIYPADGSSLEELINKADISMYQVKNAKA